MESQKKRILIADSSSKLIETITLSLASDHYSFAGALTGDECLEKIKTFHPDLILLDLLLPHMHGIEILKQLQENPETKRIGVIISSFQGLFQNYHAAISEGASYFLNKPFEVSFFLGLIERFFSQTLQPDPFRKEELNFPETQSCYVPKIYKLDQYIKFWGTRGSSSVSGAKYIRYGGNTSCLEIVDGQELIIIDAGTGIRPLGITLSNSYFKTINLVISHTHWDHITGFPFFDPIYNEKQHIRVFVPVGFEKSSQKLFTEMLAYSFFPVRLDDIKAKLSFEQLRDSESITLGNVHIKTHYAYHPGSTLCFKINIGKKTFGYATDNEVLMGYHGTPLAVHKNHPILLPYESQIEFFKHCDFIIHEAQYTPVEYQKKVGWGHSSISNAAIFIKHCGIKEWIVTHHDPHHTDEDLEKKEQLHQDIMEDNHIHCHTRMAYDGLLIPI